MLCVTVTGTIMTVVKLISYALVFSHLLDHNNAIGKIILEPAVVKSRNRTNAISMLGQFVTW